MGEGGGESRGRLAMMSGKNQASQQLTAFGSMLQASTYGLTIPVIFGLTQSPLLPIWAANLRQGGSTKKFKQMKKGVITYVENIDFLLGKNPILGALQMWNNGALLPLTVVKWNYVGPGLVNIFVGGSDDGTGPPDPHFYAVIGVTVNVDFSETFDDYGGTGPVTVSGTWEVPLWNRQFIGPDPTGSSAQRNYPFGYNWQPGMGPVIALDVYPWREGATFNVYYAQLMAATSYVPPIAKLSLAFENILGSGSEYDGFSAQQIQYPWYAGLGSPDIDLGSSGAIPALKAEVQGKFGIYPTGDCDFVDMIEDIIKSGITQAALGGSLNFGPTQHGCGAYTFPGAIQMKELKVGTGTSISGLGFDLPNTAGNILVIVLTPDPIEGEPVVTDTQGNTWVLGAGPVGAGAGTCQYIFYALNCKAGPNGVTFTAAQGVIANLYELAGVDSFDAAAAEDEPPLGPTTCAITTTNQPGFPSLILMSSFGDPPSPGLRQLWKVLAEAPGLLGPGTQQTSISQRNVSNPGTYSATITNESVTNSGGILMAAFKATVPATYPNPLPDFLDAATRELTRMQCRAGGLWGSLSMNSQQAASDWIKTIAEAANCAPVFSGFRLKLIPRSEVSAAANGAVYVSPTAAGPVANLDTANGDFMASAGESPLQVVRKARTDTDSVLQMQHINRASSYQQVVTAVPDPASVALFGVRKKDPDQNNAVQDVAIARSILTIQIRRRNYVDRLSYEFKLNQRWAFLEAMDLVTVSDEEQGIAQIPVRLTSVEEDDQLALACEAEPFIYGVHAPQSLATIITSPYSPSSATQLSAGDVNPPILFEPVPELCANQPQAQIWAVISSTAANFGGCQAWVSTDGGSSYNPAGDPILGSAVTGKLTAVWPAETDPDTTNDLLLDMSESNGVIESISATEEDNFLLPCIVTGADMTVKNNGTAVASFSLPTFSNNGVAVAGPSLDWDYELMAYATAVLTGTNLYTLKATGAGNQLRRSVYNAPASGAGITHSAGERFAVLSPAGMGIFKVNLPSQWVGTALHFKFPSFNSFGGAIQSLSDCIDYVYTPTGVPY